MNHNKDNIIVPVPIRVNQIGTSESIFSQLSVELMAAKDENLCLSRELAQEKLKNQQLETFLRSLVGPSKAIPRTESSISLASTVSSVNDTAYYVGAYTQEVRKQKILKYKEKIKAHRQKVHVSRDFIGRSSIAKQKMRIKGKFVKSPVQV
ncbi:unnamed protein product [Blepharisma stoltei]|uniref:CCT domain-containing protein n=1 Tax=Blepharisma stoltei TaxID=1481888 RepID=A0AAU9ILE3_9CILI|nr:unnamed protein product [Blepharisma stoltei]